MPIRIAYLIEKSSVLYKTAFSKGRTNKVLKLFNITNDIIRKYNYEDRRYTIKGNKKIYEAFIL